MRTDYLNVTQAVQLDSTGAGTIQLRPDTGQFWTPKLIRVSTGSQSPPFTYCAIYHGAITPNTIGPSSYVDDTYTANNDASSIIAGTVVQWGESIIARFTGGSPNDTAILTIYGETSDTPPSEGIAIPDVPGTHFSGRLAVATDIPVLLSFAFPLVVATTVSTGAIQTSRFQSFKMLVTSNSNGATPYFNVRFNWYADAALQIKLMDEDFVFSANGIVTEGSGIIRGPYLQVVFTNYDFVSTNVTYNLYGSQRVENRTQFHSSFTTEAQGYGTDNVLYSNTHTVAASAQINTPDFGFYNGPVGIKLRNVEAPNTVKTLRVDIRPQPEAVFGDSMGYQFWFPASLDSTSPVVTTIILPRRVCRAFIRNNDNISHNILIDVYAQEL